MLIEKVEYAKCFATGGEEPMEDCRRCKHHRVILTAHGIDGVNVADDCQFDAEAAEKERQDELAASRIWSEK